ncbi:MAG: AraC family transcriptional regulator [Clostridia bacterium]|nr:AraC family transcriptional regulator [Clostridia bacterium]
MNDIIWAGVHNTAAPVRHQHDAWEMLYFTQSSSAFVFDDVEIVCHAGDVLVIPPETPHTHSAPKEGQCISLNIANAMLALSDPELLHDDENHSLQHLFSDALYLFQSDAAYRDALLPAYGQLLAQSISSRRRVSPRNHLVEEIAQSIAQNYANPHYELDELLKSAPYCYDYLCRLFRQEMHTTPHKYLSSLRLQAAADHLRRGAGSSITEVARMCGYSDPLYFSRMFKKKYGVSPREYGRKEC